MGAQNLYIVSLLETHFEFFANTISGAVQPIQLTLQPKKVGEQNRYVDSLLEAQKVGAQMRTLRIRLYRPCISNFSRV